jgi:hypothetical protein
MPANPSNSTWLGVTNVASASALRGRPRGGSGAGFRSTRAPAARPRRIASTTAASGTSSEQSTTSRGPSSGRFRRTSRAVRRAFAPGETTIAFSARPRPLSRTAIIATPPATRAVTARLQSIPSPSSSRRRAWLCASTPKAPKNTTRAPAREAATAWLAPLPPANVSRSPPSTVSPGPAKRATRTTRSVFELPTMITRPRVDAMNGRFKSRHERTSSADRWPKRPDAATK